jgi:hypothetical protein
VVRLIEVSPHCLDPLDDCVNDEDFTHYFNLT